MDVKKILLYFCQLSFQAVIYSFICYIRSYYTFRGVLVSHSIAKMEQIKGKFGYILQYKRANIHVKLPINFLQFLYPIQILFQPRNYGNLRFRSDRLSLKLRQKRYNGRGLYIGIVLHNLQTAINHLQLGFIKKLDLWVPHKLTQKNIFDRIDACKS